MPEPLAIVTLPNIAAFCRSYETESFTRAAELLGLTPQAVSRAVTRLETSLGVTLFRRTTRRISVTDAGRSYYAVCQRALSLLVEGERELSLQRRAPSGVVRLSVPTTYGHHRLLPALARFAERYPGVEVDLHVSNHNVNFVRDAYDIAIRMGKIDDASFIARKLGDFHLGVFASPSYLVRAGSPRAPSELGRHACIAFVLPSTGRVLPWTFHPEPAKYEPKASYRVSDDVLGILTLARAGLGLIQSYDFIVAEDVARGALVEVLHAFRGVSRPFSLLYPRGVTQSRAVRAMIDFILEMEGLSRAGGASRDRREESHHLIVPSPGRATA
jgi:DNA-binding transcriptional LysR family regulator